MTALTLQPKNCMSHLLLKPTFDRFSLIEGELTTYNTFRVDGRLCRDFFEEAPDRAYSLWGELRDFFFRLIRGKRTPLNFKFILSLSEKDTAAWMKGREIPGLSPANVRGLYLNFRYDGTILQCVTGISLDIFTMDKTLEKLWDESVKNFFLKNGIDFE